MKTKIYLITAILSVLVVLIMPFGMTYAVFSDTEESTNNEMTVSINYYSPPPGWEPDCNEHLGMSKCSGNGNADGTFSYTPEEYRFFWKFDGDVPYADSNVDPNETTKIWALVTMHPTEGGFIVLGQGITDNTTSNHKHLALEGSYEFNGNLHYALIHLIELDNFDPIFIDFASLAHCACTDELVNYTDTYPE